MNNESSLPDQRVVWNEWNAATRENGIERASLDQANTIERWLAAIGADRPLDILEVGCGTGWLCERLSRFGSVTGTDIADEVLARAQERLPNINFIPGDFLTLDLGVRCFDVVVSVETMAHFEDQQLYLERIHSLLRPGGLLMLAAQNRPVMERHLHLLPSRGWYRRWVDHTELSTLVSRDFLVLELSSVTPTFHTGFLHFVNSRKVSAVAVKVGLGRAMRRIVRYEESRFLGWSLVCLAQKAR